MARQHVWLRLDSFGTIEVFSSRRKALVNIALPEFKEVDKYNNIFFYETARDQAEHKWEIKITRILLK